MFPPHAIRDVRAVWRVFLPGKICFGCAAAVPGQHAGFCCSFPPVKPAGGFFGLAGLHFFA
jgi:hypothetical protein